MANEVAKVDPARNLLASMGERFEMDAEQFEFTIRATCLPREATREEFAALLLVAKEHTLNPITREIYAFPKKGGGIIPVVSIDGWLSLINRQPTLDGYEFSFDERDGKLISCTCKMYRKDRSHPTVVTEYLDECKRGTEPWKMEHRMLRHKTMIQTARYAFGFAGIFEHDEAERIAEMRDVTPIEDAPAAPSTKKPEPAKVVEGEILAPNTASKADEEKAARDEAAKEKQRKADQARVDQERRDREARDAQKAEQEAKAKREQEEAAKRAAAEQQKKEEPKDEFEDYLAQLVADMTAAPTRPDFVRVWTQRRKTGLTDEQANRMVSERDKLKDHLAELDRKNAEAEAARKAAESNHDDFSEIGYRDIIKERARNCNNSGQVQVLIDEVEEHKEAGRITNNEYGMYYEDVLADAMNRVA